MNYFTEERLANYISELQNGLGENGEGFDFMVHVIGDNATREVLNAVEAHPNNDARHRCTHIELVSEADWPRFKQLGVIADGQVAGDFAVDTSQAFQDMLAMVGPRGQDFVPIRSIKEAGGHVTLSSDWDVSDLNPFIGLIFFMLDGMPDYIPVRSRSCTCN